MVQLVHVLDTKWINELSVPSLLIWGGSWTTPPPATLKTPCPWGSQPTGWKFSVYIETSCKTLKLVLFVQPQPEDLALPAVSHTARLGGGVRRWGVLEGSANWARHEHNNGGGDRHTCVPAVAGLTSYWSEASLATMYDLSTYSTHTPKQEPNW